MSMKTLLAGLGLAAIGMGAVTARAEEPEPQRMLFLGNSITWHEYNEGVGWLREWGMAASAAEKDYVHLMSNDVERITGVAPVLRVRNIYNIERVILTADIDADAGIAADVAFAPTVVVIAIGENFSGPSAADSATFKSQIKKLAGKFTGTAAVDKILIRAPFWSNPTQAALMKSAAEELGVKFVDAGPLGNVAANKATGLFPHAGVANHPGDTGMRALADLKMTALFPDEFAPETPGEEEQEDLPPDAPDVTEVGEYAEADGKSVSVAPCSGGSIRRLSTGEYVHVFTGDGTFAAKDLDADTEISYLIVGGGGSGGSLMGGGGGGGAARVGTFRLAKGSSATIHVGAGGIFVGALGAAGESGTASEIWQDGYLVAAAAGGGGGAGWNDDASNDQVAKTGASSGGECHSRTTPAEATDGHRGGVAFAAGCVPAGGGGAGSPGQNGVAGQAGAGGAGVLCRITGEAAYYGAGGGGGANWNGDKTYSFLAGVGGSGVGGIGANPGFSGGPAMPNTGSGGGGSAGWTAATGRGGSGADGIVVLRYAFSGEITEPEISLPSFTYSSVLTVSGYDGGEALADFPLLVRVSPGKTPGFDYAQSLQDGADIAFTTLAGDILPTELDTWNPEGESLFWVSVPRLSGKDTQLRMLWGTDESLPDGLRDKNKLWKNYSGVWHFAEPSGTAFDSSDNGNDAVLQNPATYQRTTIGVAGQVGLARHIDGIANSSPLCTKKPITSASPNDFTLTCWYKFISAASSAGDHGIVWAKPDTAWNGNYGWFMSLRTASGYPYVTGKGSVQHDANVNAKDGWHYLTMIVRDGKLVAGCDGKMVGITGSGSLDIQSSANGYFGYFATCEMDELRIRTNSDVSSDCIAAEYAQMTNADFVVFSRDARMPVADALSVRQTGRGKARISVDITSLGEGAQWADLQVELVAAGDDEPAYQTLRRMTATGTVTLEPTGLKGDTAYDVRVKLVNDFGLSCFLKDALTTKVDLAGLGFRWYSEVTPAEFGSGEGEAPETLADFPLMVRVSPQLVEGFSYDVCRADGKDVAFVNGAGEFLPSELDTWNPAGESIFWVKVPKFNAETRIFLVWSSKKGVDTHPADVWSDYVGVWHMNETSGNAVDSTDRGHDAVLDSAFAETCVGTNDSMIGRARYIPQNLTVPKSNTAISPLAVPAGCTVDNPTNFSIQCWYKYQEYTFLTGDPGILYAKDPKTWNAADGWFLSAVNPYNGGSNALMVYFTSRGSVQTKWNTMLEVDAWGEYVVTVEQGTVCLYQNGSLVKTNTSKDGEAITLTNPTYPILFAPNVTCAMDEVRIRNKPISAAWAAEEHRSMTSETYLSFTPAKALPKSGLAILIY